MSAVAQACSGQKLERMLLALGAYDPKMTNARLAAFALFGLGVLFTATAWGDGPAVRGAPRTAPPPAPPIAPAPKDPPKIGVAPRKVCATEPLKVTKVATSETPERCRPTQVVVTITAQNCGAPGGGRYRILAGDKELGAGDVSALAEGASVDVKAPWTPPPTGTVVLGGEVGPRSSAGAGTGSGGDTGLDRMFNGSVALQMNRMLSGLGSSLTLSSTALSQLSGDVKATKDKGNYPSWIAAIFDGVAKSYDARSKQAWSLAQAVVLVCPSDAGAKTQPWFDEVVAEIKKANDSNKSIPGLLASGTKALDTMGGVGALLGDIGKTSPFPGWRPFSGL